MIIPQPNRIMIKYIRLLYIKANINGIETMRVLVDNGVGVNILPLVTLKKVRLEIKNLKRTDVFIND